MASLIRFSFKVSTLALISALAVSPPSPASAVTLTDINDSLDQKEHQPQGITNQILQDPLDSIYQEKQGLAHSILHAVQAEPNQVEQTQRCLNTSLTQDDFPQELASTLNMLSPRLLQPEALILKDHERHFLSNPSPTSDHPALTALNKILQDLIVLIPSVSSSLHTSLRDLQIHYTNYRDRLLVAPMADRPALLHPKAILSGEGLFPPQADGIRSYRISQEMAYELLSQDKYGLSLRRNTTGSHAVSHQGSVYFKGNSASDGLPVGREAASYLFSQALFKRGMAPTALLTLNDVEIQKPPERTPAAQNFSNACRDHWTSAQFFQHYPQYQDSFTQKIPHHVLQASHEVQGLNLQTFLQQDVSFQNLCPDSFSEQIILSLLINPSDGKADNFMVQQDSGKIIGIDNDKAFGPSIVQQSVNGQLKHSPGVKNILYFFPLMEEALSSSVRSHLLSISPEQVILQWLRSLQHQEESYQQLRRASYQKGNLTIPYLSDNLYRDSLLLPLKFNPDFIAGMTQRLRQIQQRLQERPATTHAQLFHVIDPLTARFYQALRSQGSILDSFQRILHDNHEKLYFEDVLAGQREDRLSSGQTVAQALAQETHAVDETPSQTQTLKEARLHYLRQLDLRAHKNVNSFINMSADLFEDLLQDPQQLHASWSQEDLLLRALEDKTSLQGIKFLLELGSDIRLHHPQTQQTVFHKAAEGAYSRDMFDLLAQGLRLEEQQIFFNHQDNRHCTPLDYALLSESEVPMVALIELGATECSPSLALKFYKSHSTFSLELSTAFQKLMAKNEAVEWEIALEELLPPVRNNHSDEMTLYLSRYGSRRVPAEIQSQLLDLQGRFIPCQGQGNHLVSRAQGQGRLKPHHLYFKVYPALPGLEEASGSLTRGLLGFGAPYTDLAKIGSYPVLISQGIWGPTLLKVFQENPEMLKDLVDEDVSGMIMAAMLINPEDGKPDNYIVTPHPTQEGKYRLIGIDNDQAFVPAIVKEKPDRQLFSGRLIPVAQVKTILYCLDQMKQPVSPALRTRLINLSPNVFLQDWLKGLKRLNQSYSALFTAQDQVDAFKKFESFIGVPFQQGAIKHLYEKLVDLRDLLVASPNISHIDLLSKLEPRLSKRYQVALAKDQTPWQRFQEVDRPFYDVKQDGSHTTLTKSGMILQSAGIPLQEKLLDAIRLGQENSPIQALEELAQIIKEKSDQALEGLAARVGDIKLLQTLSLEKSRSAFLQQLIQQNKVLSPQEQNAVLNYLTQQKRMRKLLIPQFNMLVDVYFASPLWLEHLTHVDMRYCNRITNFIPIVLAKGALSLEILNLGHLPQLGAIGGSGFLRPTLLEFPSLHTLSLVECINLSMMAIQAPKLTWLDVSGCAKLTGKELDNLIEWSPRLKTLNLGGCDLIDTLPLRQEFPSYPISFLKNLTTQERILKVLRSKKPHLDLSYVKNTSNFIDDSPQGWKAFIRALANTTTLTSLDLGLIDVGDIGAQALARNTTLRFLNLRSNRVCLSSVGDAGAQALARNTTLRHLNLKYNKITVRGAQALAANTTLISLDLLCNQLGDAGAQALARNTTLRFLNLLGNQVEDTGIQALAANTTFRFLNLSENKVKDIGIQALAANTTLTSLKLRGNQITDVGAQAIARNTTLTSLDLSYNDVGDAGVRALDANTTLLSLKLRGNQITDAGIQVLAANTTLTSLKLDHHKLTDVGAQAIARNTTLLSLDLGGNKIIDVGAQAFAHNTTLTSLKLSFHKLTDVGAQAIARNTTLLSLDLSGNKITDVGAQAFAHNTTLTSLDLGYNKIGEAGKVALRRNNNLKNLRLER